ncbi:MAG: hypothetical protein MJ153_07845 [Clostridia bacterium]|nr:hypothetical protein [Clostridia bacterium]
MYIGKMILDANMGVVFLPIFGIGALIVLAIIVAIIVISIKCISKAIKRRKEEADSE